MEEFQFISVREFCSFHDIDIARVQEFFDFGLLIPHEHRGMLCVLEEDIEPLETMLRLRFDLGINLEGVETIMHLRRRIQELQSRLEEMEYQLKKWQSRI